METIKKEGKMRNKDFQNGQLVRMAMLVGGILLLSYVVMLQTGYAGQNVNNTPTNRQLMITEVYVDFGNNTIDISGLNFDNGGIPKVMLGNYPTPLTLVGTPTASQIVAMLPDVPDGDYLLKVSTGQGVINYGSYNLTIGAVGPQGPQGEEGPQGIQGIQGPQGVQGQQGIQGTAGIHCWDLNANGVCDAATEDKNADTLCNVNDCKGPQGPPGAPGTSVYFTAYTVTQSFYCTSGAACPGSEALYWNPNKEYTVDGLSCTHDYDAIVNASYSFNGFLSYLREWEVHQQYTGCDWFRPPWCNNLPKSFVTFWVYNRDLYTTTMTVTLTCGGLRPK